jgi:hypothetical protein
MTRTELVWFDAEYEKLRVPRAVLADWKRHDPPMMDTLREGVLLGVIGVGDRW